MGNKEMAIEKAKKVRFVILDIHGVLTDNVLYYTEDGKKSECISLRDRLGCKALIYGIPPEKLWGTSAKMGKLEEFKKESGLGDQDFCYVGDEMIDLGIMKKVGFSVAPADASVEAQEVADYITKVGGSKGVVREIAEFILKAQGKWNTVIDKISKQS